MYHDPRSPKRQFETSLAYQGNNDTVRERERERDRGYLTLNEKEVKVDPTKHEFPSPCVTNGKFTLEKDRRDHCLRRENKRNEEWNRCIRR